MAVPSAVRLPQGEAYRLVKTDDGMYSVENAYEGNYEYFENRPTEINPFSISEADSISFPGPVTIVKAGE